MNTSPNRLLRVSIAAVAFILIGTLLGMSPQAITLVLLGAFAGLLVAGVYRG